MTPSAPSDSQCFLPSKIGYQGGLSLKIFLGNPYPILLELCCFHDFMSHPTKKLQYKNAAVNDLESLFGMHSEASNEGLSWTDCSVSLTLHFWKQHIPQCSNEWLEQSCHHIPRYWTISCNEGFQMNATHELFNLRLSVCKIRPYNFVCFLGTIK